MIAYLPLDCQDVTNKSTPKRRLPRAIVLVVRTTISLPARLLENAKQRAAERGVTLSALVAEALRGLLGAFRLYTVRGTLVDPHMDLDRTSALVMVEDEASFRGQPR